MKDGMDGDPDPMPAPGGIRDPAEAATRYAGPGRWGKGEEVSFWPRPIHGSQKEAIREEAQLRAATLFRSILIYDPLAKYKAPTAFGPSFGHLLRNPIYPPPDEFKLIPSDFLRQAQAMPPDNPQATASAFAQWIYSLYSSAYGNDEDRQRGKAMEQEILDLRKQSVCCCDNRFLRSIGSNWELAHNGMHRDGREPADHFRIDHLAVNGSPLRASPDLVYYNERNSEVIIVEIKYSRLPITTNLWPNVWAQLWCYSQIEIARGAQKLTVVGEVWGEQWTRARRGQGTPILYLRASVRRDPRAPAYDRFFRKLFDIYRGS